jgi:chaperonin GroES
MKVKPLNDWAVLRPVEAAIRTAGGIYIPESAKEKPAEGVVVAIGPGAYEEEKRGEKKQPKKERKFIPTSVKPGDRVLYERYAGQEMTVDGEDIVLVREKNILGLMPAAPERPQEELPPLMLPHMTASPESRQLARRETTAMTVKKEAAAPMVKKAAKPKKAAKKAVKKAAPKPKKAAKKAASKKGKKK